MSKRARSPQEAITRLLHNDYTLKHIAVEEGEWSEQEIEDVVDHLCTCSNELERLLLIDCKLKDRVGTKIARFVEKSTTLATLHLTHNKLTAVSFRALARALLVNSSLRVLCTYQNIKASAGPTRDFIDALRFGPERPEQSLWILYYNWNNDHKRCKEEADKLGHPSLLELLVKRHFTNDRMVTNKRAFN